MLMTSSLETATLDPVQDRLAGFLGPTELASKSVRAEERSVPEPER